MTEKIVPHLDFQVMTYACGWKKALEEQPTPHSAIRWSTNSARYCCVRTVNPWPSTATSALNFFPYEPSQKKNRAVVRSKFYPSGGQPVAVDYRLRNKNGWKIYDIKIDGISLVKEL